MECDTLFNYRTTGTSLFVAESSVIYSQCSCELLWINCLKVTLRSHTGYKNTDIDYPSKKI